MSPNLLTLKEIIGDRPVGIMLHGSSIETLETKILDLKKKNICWVSLSIYEIMEKYILDKIDKKLDVILDCGSVSRVVEKQYESWRVPRLKNFVKRPYNNLYITTKGLVYRDFERAGQGQFYKEWKHKILVIDEFIDVFDVPNSLTILLIAISLCNPKKIILFGCDGANSNDNLNTYYKPEERAKERVLSRGDKNHGGGLKRDTNNFNDKFRIIFNSKGNSKIEILNCSPNSLINVFPKISYNELEEIL